LVFVGLLVVCALAANQFFAKSDEEQPRAVNPQANSTPSEQPRLPDEQEMAQMRLRMVDEQLRSRDIADERVLAAMSEVPRHLFVPAEQVKNAYADRPLPIGNAQTISQPYIVALMTQLAEPRETSRALDIGTGSGYQAAVLAEVVRQVYSVEIIEPLANEARERLRLLQHRNIEVRHGDGYLGWREHAPFDLIIVAAAPDHDPPSLVEQLAPGGKLVLPVGNRFRQELLVIEKHADGTTDRRVVVPVAFVPMTGAARGADSE
jgi:protein-L-isoaspartate(D-aspartate) O-methyltransferase